MWNQIGTRILHVLVYGSIVLDALEFPVQTSICICLLIQYDAHNKFVFVFLNMIQKKNPDENIKLEAQGPCTGHRSIIAILHCFPLHEKYTN